MSPHRKDGPRDRQGRPLRQGCDARPVCEVLMCLRRVQVPERRVARVPPRRPGRESQLDRDCGLRLAARPPVADGADDRPPPTLSSLIRRCSMR